MTEDFEHDETTEAGKEDVLVPAPVVPEDASAEPMVPLTAAVVAMFAPSLATVATQRISTRRMWWARAFGVVLGVFVIALVVAGSEVDSLEPLSVADMLVAMAAEVFDEFARYPGEFFLLLVATVVGIEAIFALAAFAFMPAGARDEPLRASYTNALRQLWLGTSRIAMVILFAGAVGTTLNRVDRVWERTHPGPEWPQQPPQPNRSSYADQAAFDQAMVEYGDAMLAFQKATTEYWSEYFSWRETKPWYIRNYQLLIVLAAAVGTLWFVLMLLRASGVPRAVEPADRPPLCERCGYNLTAAALESRCPECGAPVAESLGDDVRSGAPWEHRGRIGAWRAFFATAWCAMSRPSALGRRLRVGYGGNDHHRFAAMLLPLIFVVGSGTMVTAVLREADPVELRRQIHFFCTVPVIFGIACVVGAIAVSLFAALLVGFSQSIGTGRNLMPVARQASCYLFGLLVLWELFGAVTGFAVTWLESTGCFRSLQASTGIGDDFWAFAVWAIPNAVWGIAFLVFVSQATVASRFANK